MAPEQLRGQAATSKSDQFAFCVGLFEALFGVRPHAADTFADLVANVLTDKRRDVDTGAVPQWLLALLDRGLATRHEDRFHDMDALLQALDRGRLEGGLGSTPTVPRRSKRWSTLALLALCTLAGGIALQLVAPELRGLGSISFLLGLLIATGLILAAGLYLRGSLRRFGTPRSTRELRTSVPAERVLELLVRNAGHLDYVVDDQDWLMRRLCLRVRAGFWSVGSYIRVGVDDSVPAAVVLDVRPVLPAWVDFWWRGPSDAALARIEALLGDARSFPPR
jgi:hypothetical protein